MRRFSPPLSAEFRHPEYQRTAGIPEAGGAELPRATDVVRHSIVGVTGSERNLNAEVRGRSSPSAGGSSRPDDTSRSAADAAVGGAGKGGQPTQELHSLSGQETATDIPTMESLEQRADELKVGGLYKQALGMAIRAVQQYFGDANAIVELPCGKAVRACELVAFAAARQELLPFVAEGQETGNLGERGYTYLSQDDVDGFARDLRKAVGSGVLDGKHPWLGPAIAAFCNRKK